MGGKPTERYHPGNDDISHPYPKFPFPKMLVSWMSFLFQRVGDVKIPGR